MINIYTPMQVLVNAKEQLESEAIEKLEGEKLEGYQEALSDMYYVLSEYF